MVRARLDNVHLDYEGMGELLRSAGVRAALTARMERVLETAKANAPVKTGAYRDGLHLEQRTTDRAVVRVAGSTDHDWLVEADTGNLARSLGTAR
jgi:hypothetical protein